MINKNIFELANAKGISEKHTKLLLLCSVLIIIKFVLFPIIEWQSELKQETNFYLLQLRDENSINNNIERTEKQLEKTAEELTKIAQYYYSGSATSNQVKLNELVSKKVEELKLSLASQNVRSIQTKNGIETLEYTFNIRGTGEPLANFIYWIETVQPQLLIKNLRFTSVRRSARTEINLRVHQLISVEQ